MDINRLKMFHNKTCLLYTRLLHIAAIAMHSTISLCEVTIKYTFECTFMNVTIHYYDHFDLMIENNQLTNN